MEESPSFIQSKRFSKSLLYMFEMDAFRALAEPRRRRVVEILARRGRLSASQISREFDVTPQAISQHLRVLREANVLLMEKRAQRRLYTFNPRSTAQIQVWTDEMARLWRGRLDRLDKALKEASA
jgi:DNA-binding transcriptional ArsR family regulator